MVAIILSVLLFFSLIVAGFTTDDVITNVLSRWMEGYLRLYRPSTVLHLAHAKAENGRHRATSQESSTLRRKYVSEPNGFTCVLIAYSGVRA